MSRWQGLAGAEALLESSFDGFDSRWLHYWPFVNGR